MQLVVAQSLLKQPSSMVWESHIWPRVRSSGGSLTALIVGIFRFTWGRQISVKFARVHIKGVAHNIPAIIDCKCVKQKERGASRNEVVEVGHHTALSEECVRIPVCVNRSANNLVFAVNGEGQGCQVSRLKRAEVLDTVFFSPKEGVKSSVTEARHTDYVTFIVDVLRTVGCSSPQ